MLSRLDLAQTGWAGHRAPRSEVRDCFKMTMKSSIENAAFFEILHFCLVYTLGLGHLKWDSYNPSDDRYYPNDRLRHTNADSHNARDKRNHSKSRKRWDESKLESSSMSASRSSKIGDHQTIDQSPPRYGWARMLAHHNFRKATTRHLLPFRITSHWRFYASMHTICHRRPNLMYRLEKIEFVRFFKLINLLIGSRG